MAEQSSVSTAGSRSSEYQTEYQRVIHRGLFCDPHDQKIYAEIEPLIHSDPEAALLKMESSFAADEWDTVGNSIYYDIANEFFVRGDFALGIITIEKHQEILNLVSGLELAERLSKRFHSCAGRMFQAFFERDTERQAIRAAKRLRNRGTIFYYGGHPVRKYGINVADIFKRKPRLEQAEIEHNPWTCCCDACATPV
jgi:hypothetical protein